MNRKSRRSSILKPPKPITKSPLRDINCLPRDENDEFDNQPNTRRVSFSRKSHVKEFDPTITYMEQWNKSHEESLNSTGNDENQPESCGLPYVHSAKMIKRKRTSSVQLSLNTGNSEAVGGECSSTNNLTNVETRTAKQARKSLPALGSNLCGKGDMSAFYDELDITKSIDCSSASISTNFSVTLVGEDSFNFPEPTGRKGRKSVSTNHADVIKSNATLTNLKNSEQNPKAAGKGTHGRNSISNYGMPTYGPEMPMLNSTLIPSKNAVMFDPDMDMTMSCGVTQDLENGPCNFYDESTAGVGTTLKQSLGSSPQEKRKSMAKNESPCDNSDDMDCTLAAGSVEVVRSSHVTPLKTEQENESRLSAGEMKLSIHSEKVKSERYEIEDSGLCGWESNVKEANLLSKVGLDIEVGGLSEAPTEKKAHLSIPESNEEIQSWDTSIIQERQSSNVTCSVMDGMDFTVPLGKLKVASSGSSNVDLSVEGRLNESKEHMMISHVDSSEMEFTLVSGGLENVRDGNETIISDKTATSNNYTDASSMNLTCAVVQAPEKAEHNLIEEAVAESGIQEDTAGTDQVEEVFQASKMSSRPSMDLSISNSESSDQGTENVNSSQISENISSNGSDMEGMDFTVPLGKIQQKLPKEPVASPMAREFDLTITNPDMINDNGEGNTTLHSQSMDETCADMEGMELTVPLGQLKVNKAVEHSEKVIDSAYNNDVISSGETPLEGNSPTILEVADDRDDAAHDTENSTTMKDCETLNETCGTKFTVPLGKSQEKNAESIVSSMDNGIAEAVSGDENFEAVDEACGVEFTVPVGRIEEKNEEVSTIGIEGHAEVMTGNDAVINETVECVDKTCDANDGMAFKVAIEEGCKNVPIPTMDAEGPVDVTDTDASITDNLESLGEISRVGNGMDFTVPLGRIKERTRLSPILSVDDEGSIESKGGNVTINENFESLDETCGAESCMELTVPLGRIKDKSEGTIADTVNGRAAAMVSGHFSITENVDFIDQTCVAGNEMESNTTVEEIKEENGDSYKSSMVIGEPVEILSGNVTIYDNVESMDETCGVGMDFTVPLGRIKGKSEEVLIPNMNNEVTGGNVIINENYETFDDTCGDGNGVEFGGPLEKSEEENKDVPMSSVDVEGAVEVSYGNITINDNLESLDETCGVGMDFTVPLGRIKEKAEEVLIPTMNNEVAYEVNGGNVTINENFESIDDTCGDGDGVEFKTPLEKSEEENEDVPMSSVDVEGAVEVSYENITINDNLESIDETCGDGSGVEFKAPFEKSEEENRDVPMSSVDVEGAVEVSYENITINDNLESIDETCGDGSGVEFKAPFEKSEEENRAVPMSSVDVEGAVEVSYENITINDNLESIDETCGDGSGVEFKAPFEKSEEENRDVPMSSVDVEGAVEVSYENITINDNLESIDETCGDASGVEFKAPFEKSEEENRAVPMSSVDVEGAVEISYENITINENFESIDETCCDGNGVEFKAPFEKSEEENRDVPMSSVDVEGAVEVSYENITINDNLESIDETCGDGSGVEFKAPFEKSEEENRDVPMSSVDVEGAVEVSYENITINDNLESIDETCGDGSGVEFKAPFEKSEEENRAVPMSSVDVEGAVEISYENITINENFESIDETCCDGNGVEFKAPFEKSEEENRDVPMSSVDVEGAVEISYENITINENFESIDETCCDGNGVEFKAPFEKSEEENRDVPMSSVDVEGAVVENGNVTILDSVESLDETCGVGMDFTIPLGRIKEKNQVGPVASMDDVAAVKVTSGDITITENFETLDETCADDNEAELKPALERSEGEIKGIPRPSMDFEVTFGDVTINENVESLDDTCGADNVLELEAPCKKMAEEDKDSPISSMDVEETIDATSNDVPICEKFETFDETHKAEKVPEFTDPLDKTMDKNEDVLVSSVYNEVGVKLANGIGDITIDVNQESVNETCGLENGMDFTVPLGRIKEKALISSVDDNETSELVAKSEDITIGESCETVHPNCGTDDAVNGEGEPDRLLAMKSILNETLTNEPRNSVNMPSLEVDMPSRDLVNEDSCDRVNVSMALDCRSNEETPVEDVGMDMSIANENLESHNIDDVTTSVVFSSDSSPASKAIAGSEDCLKESEVIDEPMQEDLNHSTTLVEIRDPEESFTEMLVPLETMEVPEGGVLEKSVADVTVGFSPDVSDPITEKQVDMHANSDVLKKDVAESVPPVEETLSKGLNLKSPAPADSVQGAKICDETVLSATEDSVHEEVVNELRRDHDGDDSVGGSTGKNTSFVGESEPEVPVVKYEQQINAETLETLEESGIPAEDINSTELDTTPIAMKASKMLNDESVNVCDDNGTLMEHLVRSKPTSEAKVMGFELSTPLDSPKVCNTETDDDAIVTLVTESVQVVGDLEGNHDEEMDVDSDPLVENQMKSIPSAEETPSNEVDMDSPSLKKTFEVEIPDKPDECVHVSLQVSGKTKEAISSEDLSGIEGNVTTNMDCLSKENDGENFPSVEENRCEALDSERSHVENLPIQGECIATSELGVCSNINSSSTSEMTSVPEHMDLSISEEIGLADDDPLSKPPSNSEVLNGTNAHSNVIPENVEGSSSVLNLDDEHENARTNDKSVRGSDAGVKCLEVGEGNNTCEMLPTENSISSHSGLWSASLEKIAINMEASTQNITFRNRRSGSTHNTKPHDDTSDHEEEKIIKTDSNGGTEVSRLCESGNDSMMEALDENKDDGQDPETEMETDSSDNSSGNSYYLSESCVSDTLNSSAGDAPPILSREWIQKELEKKSCNWVIKELLDDQLSFYVFRRSVELIVNLKPLENSEGSAVEREVESVVMKSTTTKPIGACIEMVNRILLNRFPSSVLSSKCTSIHQLSSLMNFLDAELKGFENLLEQIRKMYSRSPADLLADGFSFKVVSMKLLVFFEVQVCLSNWENGGVKPEDVTVRNVIGKTQLSDIQEVVQGVKRDCDYLFNIYEAVLDFIISLEKLID